MKAHLESKGCTPSQVNEQLKRFEETRGRRWYDASDEQAKRFDKVVEKYQFAHDPWDSSSRRWLQNDRVKKALALAREDINKGWLSGECTSNMDLVPPDLCIH